MSDDFATALLPTLSRSLKARFNVFDVMHHGTHEKQISNVFGWLLDAEGSHQLGDRFLRLFIGEVNLRLALAGNEPLAVATYMVLQEVNTSNPGEPEDIADLVLTNDDATIVIENYFTSDGHGHSYCGYLRYSQRDNRRGVVVLLCASEDSSLQTKGWEEASVVTYGGLLDRIRSEIGRDHLYQKIHPEPYAFIDQMHRKFVKGRRRVEDRQVLDFVTAMCTTGEAGRYGEKAQSSAAERFANDVAEQARERFKEGRELLQRTKGLLRNYGAEVLRRQLDASQGDGFVRKVSATHAGNYQWTVNFEVADKGEDISEPNLQLKFGPSAWFANEEDPYWNRTVDKKFADYSHLFLTWSAKVKEVRQSDVRLHEVLDGLPPDDLRLHDEIVQLIRGG